MSYETTPTYLGDAHFAPAALGDLREMTLASRQDLSGQKIKISTVSTRTFERALAHASHGPALYPEPGRSFPTAPLPRPARKPAQIGGTALFWGTKRCFDVVVSLILLPLLALIAVLLSGLNLAFNRGPLLFRQTRMGQATRPFTAIKFRSMQPVAKVTRSVDEPIEEERITPLGHFLRKSRVDELPQIINVLRGEMSLIGPRPDYFEHAQEYLAQIPEYRDRHVVRPGISGLAQVTLGYAQGLDETRAKATADLAYIRNASASLEARIFWQTLVTIALRRGA